jgi:hypothetical protein
MRCWRLSGDSGLRAARAEARHPRRGISRSFTVDRKDSPDCSGRHGSNRRPSAFQAEQQPRSPSERPA